MIPKVLKEGFKGKMSESVFGDWIEVLSGQSYEDGDIIKLPTDCYYLGEAFLEKKDGFFYLQRKSAVYYSYPSSYTPKLRDFPILYFDEKGSAYEGKVIYHDVSGAVFFEIPKWKKTNKLINISETFFVNTEKNIAAILKRNNPYVYEYMENEMDMFTRNKFVQAAFLVSPELELLLKANYSFAEGLIHKLSQKCLYGELNSVVQAYNRLVNNRGKNVKEIFKTDKCVYSALKNEKDLKIWDDFRRMYKKGRLNAQEIKELYMSGYVKDLKLIDEILRKKSVDGKSYFTFNSLLKYLRKIDIYEAIDFFEGIGLLDDYLSMCKLLDIKPNLSSDSLKREHDVTARIVRTKRNEKLNEQMKEPCSKASKYNYDEGTFFIRSVKDYNDLVDEAVQQRSCVAVYGERIAKKQTMIFVMRQNKYPDKSVATVELTDDGEIRQARLACNKPITNKAQNDFLKRWRKHVLSIMHGCKTATV